MRNAQDHHRPGLDDENHAVGAVHELPDILCIELLFTRAATAAGKERQRLDGLLQSEEPARRAPGRAATDPFDDRVDFRFGVLTDVDFVFHLPRRPSSFFSILANASLAVAYRPLRKSSSPWRMPSSASSRSISSSNF